MKKNGGLGEESGLDDRLLEDQDGRDYIVAQIDRILNILARASTLFNEGNSTTLG